MVEYFLHIDRIPEHNGVYDESKDTELFFLSFTVVFAHFTALSMVHPSREPVAILVVIELRQRSAPINRVANIIQVVNGLHDAAELA